MKGRRIRSAFMAGAAAIGLLAAQSALAECQGIVDGTIQVKQWKVGFIVGVSGGGGTLMYKGQSHAFDIDGLRVGATAGIATTDLEGQVYNLRKLEDFNGLYGGGQAAVSVIKGKKIFAISNNHGVCLQLAGKQEGIEIAVDLDGMSVKLK